MDKLEAVLRHLALYDGAKQWSCQILPDSETVDELMITMVAERWDEVLLRDNAMARMMLSDILRIRFAPGQQAVAPDSPASRCGFWSTASVLRRRS